MEAAALLASLVTAVASLVVITSVVAWSFGAWLARATADFARDAAPEPRAEDNRVRRFAPAGSCGLLSRLVRVPVGALLLLVAAPGCKRRPGDGEARPAASAAASSSAAPAVSHSAAPPPSAPLVVGPPSGEVISDWRAAEEVKPCQSRSKDLDPGLASGLIAMAGRGKEVAVAWFYNNKVKGEGLVAFSGYDAQMRPLGQPHGLGKGVLSRPTIVPRKDGWLALWFDAEGLAFSRATWAATLPSVDHLRAVTVEEAPHTAIVRGRDGHLVAVAPLAPGETAQLGLFAFAPEGEGDPVKALGATHHAKKPEHAALVETEDGFLVAWEDGDDGKRGVKLTRFDAAGKELGDGVLLSTPGVASSSPALVDTKRGAIAAWIEAGTIVVRALDEKGGALGPARKVASGERPVLVRSPMGASLVFLHKRGDVPPHVAAVHVAEDGSVPPWGVVLSDAKGKVAIADPPAAAALDEGRLAVGFVYADGMKGALRVVKIEGCLVDAPSATP